MAVSTGTRIQATDYNAIQSIIANVLGTGSGNSGYGQALASSQLSLPATSTRITAAQWSALRTDILTCYNHQNSANGSITQPLTTIQLTANDYNAYLSMANLCATNRLWFYNTSNVSTSTLLSTTLGGNTWGLNSNSQTAYIDASFTLTQDQARYYFNTGSDLRITASLSGSWSVSSKDYSWQSTLSQMGTIVFGAYSTSTAPGATSPGTGSAIGYYDLTSTFQQIYTKSTSTYVPNKIVILAKATTSGSNVTVTIRTRFEDDNSQIVDENVQGVLSFTMTSRYASGGGISLTTPTVTGSFSVSPTIPS